MVTAENKKQPLYCSFCDRSQHEVRCLIGAPGLRAAICDDCIKLCASVVARVNTAAK